MTPDSKTHWGDTRDRLISALTKLGYPAELGKLLAEHIGSPKGIERMISYLNYVKPERAELIADEMLPIKDDIDRWREKKKSQHANASYNLVLNSVTDDE